MSSFTFQCAALPDSARVVAACGHERISRPYAFEVFLVVPDGDCGDLDLDGVLGERGALSMRTGPGDAPGEAFDYRGVVEVAELLHAEGGKALVGVTLVPALSALTHGEHSRMFSDVAMPDVARFVGAELEYADFSNADLTRADFSQAKLFRARFHRVRDEGAKFTSRAVALGDDEALAKAEAFGTGT